MGEHSLGQLEHLQELEKAGQTDKLIFEVSFYSLKNFHVEAKIRLMKVIEEFKNLKKVKLSSLNLGQAQVFPHLAQLVEGSQNRTTLQFVDFSDCGFSSR